MLTGMGHPRIVGVVIVENGPPARVILVGSDQKNIFRQIGMFIGVGGAQPTAGHPSGIHWHMNIASAVTYIAIDAQCQLIPVCGPPELSKPDINFLMDWLRYCIRRLAIPSGNDKWTLSLTIGCL